MNFSLFLGTILFASSVLAGMIQLWFVPWGPITFLKIELSILGLLGIVIVIWFVLREYRESKRTRSGGRLDE